MLNSNCEICKTSFRYYAVNLWNSLRVNVKLCENIAEFMLYFLFFVILFVCVLIRALLKNSFVH